MTTFISQAVRKTHELGAVEAAIAAERGGARREAELQALNEQHRQLTAQRLDLVKSAIALGYEDTVRFALDLHEQTPEAAAVRVAVLAGVRAAVAVEAAHEAAGRAADLLGQGARS